MFRRILVANRGEIAARIIRSCHDLGVEAVAVYSEADASSPHLELADATICIGGAHASTSYLDGDAVLQAARQMHCQAVHPGYGFLAENALFAARCRQENLTFIGPRSDTIRRMGDKVQARIAAREAGLPVIPGSDGCLASAAEAGELAGQLGYPIILKAVAGGGGRGMRVVREPGELAEQVATASAEAQAAFGNGALYLEKFLSTGRHIEFQVLADVYGHAVHLYERECSIQRNHQKLIEEAPSPVLEREEVERMGLLVARAVERLGYVGAGTVEFLRDPQSGQLYFMEMNTRIQVEHPVTEMNTGIDLVAWQLRIAANEPLTIQQEEVQARGHAIECRINAEDPARGFSPSVGRIGTLQLPEPGESVRVDTHLRPGYEIPPFYDSLVAKVIGHGDDRAGAISVLDAALGKLHLEGIPTTAPLGRLILRSPAFQSGEYDTTTLVGMLQEQAFLDALARGGA